MKYPILLAGMIALHVTVFSQKFYTKTGRITFFSSASLENIEATNKSVAVVVDGSTGAVNFTLLMKGFAFKKALMQEHFNEQYVESDKYPKAEFKGTIVQPASVNYSADGQYQVRVKGTLTIHGVAKEIEVPGTITVREGKITTSAIFNIAIADYNITVPRIYRDNIAKTIRVTVNCVLEKMN